jgi:hypothetical protein
MTITRSVTVAIGVKPGATGDEIAAAMRAALLEYAVPGPGEEIARITYLPGPQAVVEFRSTE